MRALALVTACLLLVALAPAAHAQPGGRCGEAAGVDKLPVDVLCQNEWGGWCDYWSRGEVCTIFPPIF